MAIRWKSILLKYSLFIYLVFFCRFLLPWKIIPIHPESGVKMCPVHRCGPLAESLINEKRKKKLKYAMVYFTTSERRERTRDMLLKKGTSVFYKIFFIIQCQKFIKIETFTSVFKHFYTLSCFILNIIALELKGHGLQIWKVVG